MKETEKDLAMKEMLMGPSPQSHSKPVFNLLDKDKEEEPEDNEPIFSGKISKQKLSPKYKKKLIEIAEKKPNSVFVETPEGKMTMKEAIERGYDPKTGKFIKKPLEKPSLEREMEGKGLSPLQMDKMKQMMDPRSLDMNPEEADRLGMDQAQKSKFSPNNQPPAPKAAPTGLESLLGGGQSPLPGGAS